MGLFSSYLQTNIPLNGRKVEIGIKLGVDFFSSRAWKWTWGNISGRKKKVNVYVCHQADKTRSQFLLPPYCAHLRWHIYAIISIYMPLLGEKPIKKIYLRKCAFKVPIFNVYWWAFKNCLCIYLLGEWIEGVEKNTSGMFWICLWDEEEPAIYDVAYYTLLGSYHEVELPLLKTPPKKDFGKRRKRAHLLKTIMHITKCGDAASQA